MLLPAVLLLRAGHAAASVWQVLIARAAGKGYRPTVAATGVPISTVRRWWLRFAGRADAVRRWFWQVMVAVGIDAGIPDTSGSAPADAVAAIVAAAARSERFGGSVVGMTTATCYCTFTRGEPVMRDITTMDELRLMTTKEVAALLCVSEATLCRWRQRKDGGPIPAVWLCGVPRYRRADVYALLSGIAA